MDFANHFQSVRALRDYLAIQSPYTDLDMSDPLIYSGVRRIQWAGSPIRLKRYTDRVMFFVGMSIFVFLTFVIGARGTGAFWITYGFVLIPLTGMSVAAVIVVDLFCLLYGITIMADMRQGQLRDLIFLSPVSRIQLIESRFQLAQLYAWRAVIVLVFVRGALALLWLPYIAYLLSRVPVAPTLDMRQKALILGMAVGLIPGVVYFFVYEPLWRFRQVVVIGIRHAAEWRSSLSVWAWAAVSYLGYTIGWAIVWTGISFVGFGSALIVALVSYIYDTTNLPALGLFIFMVNLLSGLFVGAFIVVLSNRQQRGRIVYLLRQSAYYVHKDTA